MNKLRILILLAMALIIFVSGCIANDYGAQPGGKACIQVIQPAKNPATGECRDFPTPCDVPKGWVKAESC